MSQIVKNVKNVQKSMWIFHSALKEEYTDPEGTPNLARYRLVDMFMSATDQIVKESIVKSFCTQLRIVICTIAFGMGVDCVNVHQIVHWGVAGLRCGILRARKRKSWEGWTGCLCHSFFYKASNLDSRRGYD